MPSVVVPFVGHHRLRERLAAAAAGGSLPNSMFLHGPAGVGKQRLALWLAQRLLCADGTNCGECQACRYVSNLTHPDLRWVFPRPREKDDADASDVWQDYSQAITERVEQGLLYGPPSGADGIHIATVRALTQAASMTPALAKRKVLVIGNAERMVPQEGADAAANAFLKLLEEPPDDTFILLTSSAPGGLLPTIQSRVAAVRVPLVSADAVAEWIKDTRVRAALDAAGLPKREADRVSAIGGAPGTVLGGVRARARELARTLIAAARSTSRDQRYAAVLGLGATGARGSFSDILSAATEILGEDMRDAVSRGDHATALARAAGITAIEDARDRVDTNAIPQLIGAMLMDAFADGRRGAA